METPKENLDAIVSGWSGALKQAEAEGTIEATKGRGRPAGGARSKVSDAPSISFDGKELRPLVKAIGNTSCRIAKVSVLSETEIEELTEAFAPVLSKYAGNSLDRWGAEVALGVIVLKVSMPRISEASANRKAAKAEHEFTDSDEIRTVGRDQF